MQTIQGKLIDLQDRLNPMDSKIQPKDRGIIECTLIELNKLYLDRSSLRLVVESLEKRLEYTERAWEIAKSEIQKATNC